MDKKYLHQQIDKFFEARLTLQEEHTLFKTLLKLEGQDSIADETLAVMLVSRMIPKPARSRQSTPVKLMAGIAASIVLIIGSGTLLIRNTRNTDSFAYVSGKKIHDLNEIKNIVSTQLQDIGESTDLFSQTLTADLEDIREALTADDI